jgi:hypothetical protein
MKRITFFALALFVSAICLTSCVKTRICKCTSASNPTANYNTSYEMAGKKQATADCENLQTEGRSSYADYTCVLD